MKISLLLAVLVAALLAPAAGSATQSRTAEPGTPRVLAIHFVQDVNPVTQSWLDHQLDRAHRDKYDAAVIVLDTPGGLEDSMRKIVQKELQVSSEGTPVLVYVAPSGARAASAGVWISQAADLLAMAPETNIGSSTPISGDGSNIGSDLRRKIINDAAASLRGLAKSHHRNAAWADKAVRVASNLSAPEALKMNVIDTISPSLPALLKQVDGRTTVPMGHTLHTANAEIVDTSPGFLTRLLSTLLDPNLISLLFLAGLAGIGFEIFHPGIVLPGALGAVSLLLALFGLAILPIEWTGLALVLLGAALLVIDAHVVSHGALTLSGLVAMGFGLATLFHDSSGTYQTSIPLVVAITVVIGGAWALGIGKAVQAKRQPVQVGPQEIIGMHGVVREDGRVAVRGELWRVHADEQLREGEPVEVDALDGLTLRVHRIARMETSQ